MIKDLGGSSSGGHDGIFPILSRRGEQFFCGLGFSELWVVTTFCLPAWGISSTRCEENTESYYFRSSKRNLVAGDLFNARDLNFTTDFVRCHRGWLLRLDSRGLLGGRQKGKLLIRNVRLTGAAIHSRPSLRQGRDPLNQSVVRVAMCAPEVTSYK